MQLLHVLFLTLCVLVGISNGAGIEPTARGGHKKEAFVSLLYGDQFLIGVRVLGQSLRETKTSRDLVAITVGNHVSKNAKNTLKSDGWIVKEVSAVQNPGLWTNNEEKKYPARFWAVYTKLLIFNMTQYDTVVYMDADAIALRSLDELFLCDGLCGVLRHSERLNTGILVVRPDSAIFSDMMSKIANVPSYTGGDQGFLNEYFAGFAAAPLFDPRRGVRLSQLPNHLEATTASGPAAGVKMGRLPTEYNADLGLFLLNSNRWMVPEDELKVLHYTISSFKPWNWWSSWIIADTMAVWQSLRQRLPPPRPAAVGVTANATLLLAPMLFTMLFFRRCVGVATCAKSLTRRRSRTAPSGAPALSPPGASGSGAGRGVGLAWLTLAAGLLSLLSAVGIAVLVIVPAESDPLWGWTLAYEWSAFLFAGFFGIYLSQVYAFGRRAASGSEPEYQDDRKMLGESTRDTQAAEFRAWATTFFGITASLVLLGLIPWWNWILGVPSFIGRVVIMGFSIAPSCLAIGLMLTTMAEAWLAAGRAAEQAKRQHRDSV